MSSVSVTMKWTCRFIAAGFCLGAAFHAASALAALAGHPWSDTPAWRHVLFVVVDGALAILVLLRPAAAWLPLLLLLGQQSSTHGRDVWVAWRQQGRIAWLSLGTLLFVAASTAIAVANRRRTPRDVNRISPAQAPDADRRARTSGSSDLRCPAGAEAATASRKHAGQRQS